MHDPYHVLSSRVSTVEYNVDDLGRKADSVNAVFIWYYHHKRTCMI
ncbi:MAG: hypothetical protein ACKPKO_48160 [Candidatus Fonsibacter sp.]